MKIVLFACCSNEGVECSTATGSRTGVCAPEAHVQTGRASSMPVSMQLQYCAVDAMLSISKLGRERLGVVFPVLLLLHREHLTAGCNAVCAIRTPGEVRLVASR